MTRFHDYRFPGESDRYRRQRDELLAAEIELRQRIEEVAALRRKLPIGGPLAQDYVFEEGAADPSDTGTLAKTRFSELFTPGKDSLVVYSFMYPPGGEEPCPMCTAFLDSLNGNAVHVRQRVNLTVVAKAPLPAIRQWARGRGWRALRLLSSHGNSYNHDYLGEDADGGQWPMMNVFRKTTKGIFHSYATELLLVSSEPGQDPRHVDSMWPLWNVFDLTPEGRGTDWYPATSYD